MTLAIPNPTLLEMMTMGGARALRHEDDWERWRKDGRPT